MSAWAFYLKVYLTGAARTPGNAHKFINIYLPNSTRILIHYQLMDVRLSRCYEIDHLVYLEIILTFSLREVKKEKEMNKKILAVLAMLSLVMGCSTMMAGEVPEGTQAKAPPVITQSFASKEVYGEDIWKVYLNASDPDGGLKYIYAVIDQLGVGEYPVSIIRVKEQDRKELSGYIYLNTWNPYVLLQFIKLTLTVQVEDKAGHFSAPVVFPLFIQDRAIQEAPPKGVFKEEDLGPIMITLHGILGGEGGGKGK